MSKKTKVIEHLSGSHNIYHIIIFRWLCPMYLVRKKIRVFFQSRWSNILLIYQIINIPFRSPTPSPLLSLKDLGYTW